MRSPATARVPAVGRTRVPRRTWWISGLFAVGSSCFAVGALPAYLDAVSARTDGLTFFIGSIFFTCASYLSFLEAANAPGAIETTPVHDVPFRLADWRPRSIDWWASAIQLVGTLYFNVVTLLALYDNWSVDQENRLVWRPDMVGSICFLVASYLAWAEVCHSVGRLRFRDLSWWIVVLNLFGSVFFGILGHRRLREPRHRRRDQPALGQRRHLRRSPVLPHRRRDAHPRGPFSQRPTTSS